jgi:molybdenum cofactor biosynthesis protein B
VGVVSISSTRTLENDKSGHWIAKRVVREGHQLEFHRVVPDAIDAIRAPVREAVVKGSPHVLILTGGTGIASRDVTIESVRNLFTKEMSAFGVLFAQLSYDQIDSAAILSRATAGLVNKTVVFCIPGSLNACKLACKYLIFPELGHIVKHTRER